MWIFHWHILAVSLEQQHLIQVQRESGQTRWDEEMQIQDFASSADKLQEAEENILRIPTEGLPELILPPLATCALQT